MAPAKTQKRAQEAKVAGNKKARVTKDPLTTALETVVTNAELPQSCREMLLTGIPPSLDTQGQRHEIQEVIITMLDELIVVNETRHRTIVVEAERAEASCQATKAELAGKLADANTLLSEKADIVDKKNAALTTAGENVDKAVAALEEQNEHQRTGDAKMVETQNLKASVMKGIEVDYATLIEGSGNCDELLPVLKTLVADDSLIQALPSTSAKTPADRGAFDTMVLDQLNQFLKSKSDELAKIIDGETAGVEERAAAVASADKHLADMKAEQAAATEAHALANSEMQSASAAVAAIKTEVKAHEQAVRAATKAHVAAVAESQVFQQSTREPFDALRFSSKAGAPEVDSIAEGKGMAIDQESEVPVSVGGA